jgi:hypothetical protein
VVTLALLADRQGHRTKCHRAHDGGPARSGRPPPDWASAYLTVTVIFFMTGMPAAITGRSAPLTWGNS